MGVGNTAKTAISNQQSAFSARLKIQSLLVVGSLPER
jgi:hypothetical protein